MKFPDWFDKTLTIYNKVIDSDKKVQWNRFVVHNSFWKRGETIQLGANVSFIDHVIVRIPRNDAFMPKHEYDNLDYGDEEDFFTLAVDDILVNGEVADEINEYVAGQRSTDLLNKYKTLGCIKLTTVNTNSADPHAPLPHYSLRGK